MNQIPSVMAIGISRQNVFTSFFFYIFFPLVLGEYKYTEQIYHRFCEMFCFLPLSASVGNNKFFCVHGGLAPGLSDVCISYTII